MQLFVYKNGQQLGPFDESQVLDQLRSGQLSASDLGIRQGESGWTPLGDLFAGRLGSGEPAVSFASPQASGQAFSSPNGAPKSGAGCRTMLGWTVLVVGLLFFLGGSFVAVATAVGYSTPLCPIADSDKAKVEELMKQYEAAKGTPREISVQIDLERALDSYQSSNEMCARELSTKRLFQVGSIFVAIIGFFMMVIGFFIRRIRRV